MGTGPELQPDELESMQAENEAPVAKVRVTKVDSPVRTQDLPRKAGIAQTWTVDTAGRRVAAADHRRAIIRLMSIGQNMVIAFTKDGLSNPNTSVVWPTNTVFTYQADTEVWVKSATSTTSVSVVTENWATGE